MSLSVCFQDDDYARLQPLRYAKLNHTINGLCVRGPWLVVADATTNTTSLYSLPDLALHHQVTVEWCHLPRAASDGIVYVPARRYITVLKITAIGNMTELRNITTVGGEHLWYPSVAVGPRPGQLCVGQGDPKRPCRLWIVDVTYDRFAQAVRLPDPCKRVWSVAALNSGQLMISYRIGWPNNSLAFYTSVADSPTVLHDMSPVQDGVTGLLGSENHFLAPYLFKTDLLVVGTDASVLHTVDAVSGKLGVYLYKIHDVAVWQDCVWLAGAYGDLVFFCVS